MTSEPFEASDQPDPGAELAGRSLGHYRVVEELGHGGMGHVYRAEDTRLGRDVALKVLSGRIAGRPRALQRFEQEARILAGLAHPNIATVHSLEEFDGIGFFTMELVPGETLESRLARGPVSVDEALALARQIAKALEAAHGKGVVHRDLKPANVLVSNERHVKILDFGLAQDLRAEATPDGETSDDTEPQGIFAGTPGYVSPEQLRQMPVDARTDLWGLGVVLFECLAGAPAFCGSTRADRLAATLEKEPDWSALPSDVGPRLRALLARCLEKDSKNRPRDAREIRREIEEESTRRRLGIALEPASDSPPLPTHNLPRRIDSFVGREAESREVTALLEKLPILTLTGAGGCGKSRLALEVARALREEFAAGTWLVEFAPLTDSALVPHTVARTLGCKESANQSLVEALTQYLEPRELLLVLDNCEHVLSAVAELSEALIRACPRLTLLATSREALGIAGETEFHLPPLAVPGPGDSEPVDSLRDVESVQLFLERTRAGRREFTLTEEVAPAVSEICRHLDGIPLALELAAARARTMTVGEIARRIDDRFSLLKERGRVPDSRHGTLRALIDWSYDLLEPPEKALLQRLSVFTGDWTLEAAEKVCGDGEGPDFDVVELHSRLVEKSLVEMLDERPARGARTRYRMLETVRQYAGELADPSERAEVLQRHRDFYLVVAEEAEPLLRGGEQAVWLTRLELEHENLRTAFATALEETSGDHALRFAGALGRYWMVRGHWSEGRDLCRRALAGSPGAVTNERARALNAAGNLTFHLGNYEEADSCHREALEIRCALGNRHDEAMSRNNLGEVARLRGDYESARVHYLQAVEIQKSIDDRWGIAVSYNNLGELAQNQGDYEQAQHCHEKACQLWPELGDRWGLAFSLSNLGFVAAKRERLGEARECYERTLSLSRELGDRYKIALSLRQLGEVALRQRDWKGAAASFEESLRVRRDLGDREGMADSLEACASLLSARGASSPAARLLGAAEALREAIHAPTPASRAEELGGVEQNLSEALGEKNYGEERVRGRALDLGDAVAIALQRITEHSRN